MSLERSKFKEAAACVATLGALASLSACSQDEPRAKQPSVIESDPRPNLDCTNAGLFTDYDSGDRILNVNVRNAHNHDVAVDTARVRVLETQTDRHFELSDNQTPIKLSKRAIQVVVSVKKDGHAYACPTIYYPNR